MSVRARVRVKLVFWGVRERTGGEPKAAKKARYEPETDDEKDTLVPVQPEAP